MNTTGGDIVVADLETFLGLGSGVLETVAPGTATAGSAIRQTITVSAGQELTFQYNFVTNESTPDATYNDFSWTTNCTQTGTDQPDVPCSAGTTFKRGDLVDSVFAGW